MTQSSVHLTVRFKPRVLDDWLLGISKLNMELRPLCSPCGIKVNVEIIGCVINKQKGKFN